MGLGTVAAAVGRGLAAGLVGTAAMTLSSTIEMRARGREASLHHLVYVLATDVAYEFLDRA